MRDGREDGEDLEEEDAAGLCGQAQDWNQEHGLACDEVEAGHLPGPSPVASLVLAEHSVVTRPVLRAPQSLHEGPKRQHQHGWQ